MALAVLALLLGDSRSGFEATPRPTPVAVTVLPFEDLSQQPEHRVLAKTLPREIVGWLAGMAPDRLRVLERTGAKNVNDGGLQAAPSIDFIVRGSVRDDRDAAVVSVELLFAADGRVAWSTHYRRQAEDTGLTARELAARIADDVASESLPQWSNGSTAATAHTTAADAFRRGADALSRQCTEGIIEAVEAFRLATELDPEFSAAYAHLAEAVMHWMGPAVTPDRVEQARQAALTHDSYAAWLSARGRREDALREIDLAAVLDPGSVTVSVDAMLVHYYARDFEGAVSAAHRLQKLWPDGHASHRYIVLSRLSMGDFAAAAADARAALAGSKTAPESANPVSGRTDSEALQAYWTRSLGAATEYVTETSGDPAALAMMQVQLDRLDAANTSLESALASRRFSYFLPYLGVSPAFDRMCGHPGFERILRRLDQSALRSGTDLPRCAATIASEAAYRERTSGPGAATP